MFSFYKGSEAIRNVHTYVFNEYSRLKPFEAFVVYTSVIVGDYIKLGWTDSN